jgi:hypothetical protein
MVDDLIRNDAVNYCDHKFSTRLFDPVDDQEMPPMNMLAECPIWTQHKYANIRAKLKSPNDAPLALSTQACQLRVEHRARHLVTTGMAEDMDMETRNTNFRAVIVYLPGVHTHWLAIRVFPFLLLCFGRGLNFTRPRKI